MEPQQRCNIYGSPIQDDSTDADEDGREPIVAGVERQMNKVSLCL